MTDDATDTNMKDDKPTLGEMSHTNPYTDEVFGNTQTYSRGKTVAADGGEANAVEDASEEEGSEAEESSSDDTDTLGDVSHTAPGDNEGAQRAYDRGKADE